MGPVNLRSRGSQRALIAVAVALLLQVVAPAAAIAASPLPASLPDACAPKARSGAAGGACVRLLSAAQGHEIKARSSIIRQRALRADLPVECGFVGGVFAPTPDRFTSCSDLFWELYLYERRSDGTVVTTGALTVENLQWTRYVFNSLTWEHGVSVFVYYGSGTLANGTLALATSLCAANPDCAVTGAGAPASVAVNLAPGADNSWVWRETDTGPALNVDKGMTLHDLLGMSVASSTTPGGDWRMQDSYLIGRCDAMVGGNKGCVNPEYISTLSLSQREFGASAAMIKWAQIHLRDQWGYKPGGNPLRRFTGDEEANRRVICDRTWVADEVLNAALAVYGPTERDSCDEFAFAASYESGNLKGVTSGAQCAQVTAIRTNTTNTDQALDWNDISPVGEFTGAERCVRGHIPLKLNTALGGELGRFSPRVRLLDRDPYWVDIVP
ncbi:hypothetical protein ACU635_58880 [[Actinomadura] parvosata]|uniref:hypothetical protein n=1 Tax=[Actinomadura] parvosata TaxID=1955412 RepID=UPI00406C1320